jgi:hypothetical protein
MAEVQSGEFTGDVSSGDFESFDTDGVKTDVKTETEATEESHDGANVDEVDVKDNDEDMIEIDACGADVGDEEKPDLEAPPPKVLVGDAEADERDLINMPQKKVVMEDLRELNRTKCLVVRTLTIDDMTNPIIQELYRSKSCSSVAFDYICSGADQDHAKIGIMTMTFHTSKQASQAMAGIQSIREDIVIEFAPLIGSASIIEKWKKDNAHDNQLSNAMLIVKNLDPATVTVEKLSEIFPDAEDIAITSQPQANNLGKLKGTKHAYLIYPDVDQANAALEAFRSNPVELDSRELIVSTYKEPPHHIPEGYLVLSTRKLVLRQIARAKGLLVRCQEDPTYEMADLWPKRLKRGTELIEKDDAARDQLGLPKPTLLDFKEMTNLKPVTSVQGDQILSRLELADSATGGLSGHQNKKRPSSGGDMGGNNAKRMNRGGNGNVSRGRGSSSSSPAGGRGGRGAGGFPYRGGRAGAPGLMNPAAAAAAANSAMMFNMMQRLPRLISPTSMYPSLTPGPGNFPLPAPRMMVGGMRPVRGNTSRGGRGFGRPY